MKPETTLEAPIDMKVTYTEADLVKLEFFRAGERLLWIDLDRARARDWAAKIAYAAETYHD